MSVALELRTQSTAFDPYLLATANSRMMHEETATGKLLVQMTPYLPGGGFEKQKRAAMLFAYIRFLEDKVDNGYYPTRGRDSLARELDRVSSLLEGKPFVSDETFPESALLPEGLKGLSDQIGVGVLGLIHNMVEGIYTDSEAIVKGEPLPPQTQRKRHLSQSMAGFEVISLLFYGKDLGGRGNTPIEDMFVKWIIYDSLIDIKDDMSAGLTLFTQAQLDRHKIKLNKNMIVSPAMHTLHAETKKTIMNELPKDAWRAHDTNFPKPMAWALWLYLTSRTQKLRKSRYPSRQMVFAANNRE